MRILLASSASYDPPRGGSTRSNLVWLRHLANSGHHCVVVGGSVTPGDRIATSQGIEIRSTYDLSRRPGILSGHIRALKPDWVLVSSEDLSHVLLRDAEAAAPDCMVYLAHTPQFYPFGPESWNPDPTATDIVRRARATVAIGHHMGAYIWQHAGVEAAVIHPPIYGAGPWPRFGRFNAGYVLMINPCQVKGITIFRSLAGRFPDVPFAALTGWGTTSHDRASLEKLPNVRLLGSVQDIEEVLSQTRLLLMPSLWYEGFGLIAMEAMLRGLPVIASDSGGLKEAKAGNPRFIVPVRPITRYLPEFDETHMPKPVIPGQDLEPWVDALRALLSDPELYASESENSRAAALHFVSTLRAEDFEGLLSSLHHAAPPAGQASPGPAPDHRLQHLSPAQRALLLKRLREKGVR